MPATCTATRSRAARSGHASASASNVTASRKALSAVASRDRTRLIVLTDAFDDDMGPLLRERRSYANSLAICCFVSLVRVDFGGHVRQAGGDSRLKLRRRGCGGVGEK